VTLTAPDRAAGIQVPAAHGRIRRQGNLWVPEVGRPRPLISGGAVTALLYGKGILSAYNKEIDLDTDTVKVALTTSSYTPDQDVHDYFNDVTNEVTGTGYTAGGATLGSKTVTYTAGTNVFAFDAADTVWSASTITARRAVVYVDTGTASTSPLIMYVDFGADLASTAAAFTITWAAAGLFTVTVS
jgi:hypothetical protein